MAREKLLMDGSWRFHKGEVPFRRILQKTESYEATKSERGVGPAASDWFDGDWDMVDLPHDYVVAETPSRSENECHGYLRRENAWYRRAFRLEDEDVDKRLTLYFEGVATHCTVYVNGHLLARSFCGYVPFEVDFTDVARFGCDLNVVCVYVDNTEFEGWFYEGGGIYRHVWLVKTEKLSIDLWGIYVNPESLGEGRWRLNVETTLRSDLYEDMSARARYEVFDQSGAPVASAWQDFAAAARQKTLLRQTLFVNNPSLWDIERPVLYRLCVTIARDGSQIDSSQVSFGFRTIAFSADEGFFLNGRNVKLRGVCVHQSHGMLGVAVPDGVFDMRVHMLKRMGANAYRTSHYPQAESLMEVCDRRGMLVMSEMRWFDSSREVLEQTRDVVRRDRNHPSVICWCLGNEELIQGTRKSFNIMSAMRQAVRSLDETRPVTLAMNEGIQGEYGCAKASDLIGINYYTQYYDKVHALFPDKPIVGTELYSTAPDPHAGNVAQGIDDWRMVNARAYVMGMFVWTGIDYRGENFWPRLFSSLGALDQNACPKESFYRYQAYWTSRPMVRIAQHWNHRAGEMIDVDVYTNCPCAELFLNGKSLGKKVVDPYEMARWRVTFASGTLRAAAGSEGRILAEYAVETAGPAAKLRLEAYREDLRADGEDVAIIAVKSVDSAGRVVPHSGPMVHFAVNEAGRILMCGNGDICAHDPWPEGSCALYEGGAQIIIRCGSAPGPLTISAQCQGLKDGELSVHLLPASPRSAVAPVFENPPCVRRMQLSPVMVNPGEDPSFEDMINNTSQIQSYLCFWPTVNLDGAPEKLRGCRDCRITYGRKLVIPALSGAPGAVGMRFREICGRAKIVVTGHDESGGIVRRSQFCKDDPQGEEFSIRLDGFARG